MFGWLPVSPDFIGHNAALGASMILVLFWNFFVNRYWTYADVPKPLQDLAANNS
jgi:putative flippase GtrA